MINFTEREKREERAEKNCQTHSHSKTSFKEVWRHFISHQYSTSIKKEKRSDTIFRHFTFFCHPPRKKPCWSERSSFNLEEVKIHVGQTFANNVGGDINNMSGNILELELQESRELSASQLHLLLHPTQEEEDEQLRKSEDIMCLNIGGKKHWVMCRNFVNFPGTRLGKLARAKERSSWQHKRKQTFFFFILKGNL